MNEKNESISEIAVINNLAIYSIDICNYFYVLFCFVFKVTGDWRSYRRQFSMATSFIWKHRIGGVMVSVLASSVVDRGLEPRSGHTKDWLARNQNNVSEWSDMSTRGLLFQWASTIQNQTQCVRLEQSRPHHHLVKN